MKQPRSTPRGRSSRSAAKSPTVSPNSVADPVRGCFAVRLPGRVPLLPPGGPSDPVWQSSYQLLTIFNGISHEIAELSEVGTLILDVEANYPDSPSGVIPPHEAGPVGGWIKQKLPAIIREGCGEPEQIFEEAVAAAGHVRGNASYTPLALKQFTDDEIYEIITSRINLSQKRVPSDPIYVKASGEIEESIRKARLEAAEKLLPELKAAMERRPHDTFGAKKELVKWTNAELKRFGLVFKSPKTGSAASFIADRGNDPDVGRFQLKSESSDGKIESNSTPHLSVILGLLELIEAPVREEGLANWADRTKKQSPPKRR